MVPSRRKPSVDRPRTARRRPARLTTTTTALMVVMTGLVTGLATAAPARALAAGVTLNAVPYAEHLPLSRTDRQDLASLISQRLQQVPIRLPGAATSEAPPDGAAATPQQSASPQSAYTYHGAPYGPADLWHMFGTPDAAAAPTYSANLSGVPGPSSSSPLVAVLEAGNYPDTYAHLTRFRSDQTLPACPVGSCITTVDQHGGTHLPGDTTHGAWAFETDMDVQVISSVCPQCRILIVAADDSSVQNLVQAAQTAVAMGAPWVSMSFGVPGDTTADVSNGRSVFNDPNVVFTASTGDSGNQGASWPSSSPYVVATGGLTVNVSGSAVSASAWSGAGSGCASDPAHQMSAAQSGDAGAVEACGSMRGASDISSIADPSTGVLTYSTVNGRQDYYFGGGTSAAAPAIAALYALAGNATSPSSIYLNQRSGSGAVTDVTAGSNDTGSCPSPRVCHAQPGWDGPTGLGLPNNLALFGVAGGGSGSTSLGPLTYAVSPLLVDRSKSSSGGVTVSAQIQATSASSNPPSGGSGGGSGSTGSGSTGSGSTGSGSTGAGGSNGGGGLLGGLLGSSTAPRSTGTTSSSASPSTTSTATLENVWFDASGLPWGMTLRAQAQYNPDGSIRSWTSVPTGDPAGAGAGTAIVTVYGAAQGHIVSSQARVAWRVAAGSWKAAKKLAVKGRAKRGHRLVAVEPKLTGGSERSLPHVRWTYEWLVDGHRVKGATRWRFTVPTSYAYVAGHGRRHHVVHAPVRRGSRITVRLTGEADGYAPARFSRTVRVVG